MLLSARNIHKSFGGVIALHGVSIEIEKGTIVGVIGPNGSGKSTLFNTISGFYQIDEGEIIFKDERIDGLPQYEIARRGLIKSFQICRIPEHMTVLENMLLAPKQQRGESLTGTFMHWRSRHKEEKQNLEEAIKLLEWVKLKELANEYAGNLSGGQKKLLVLARIVMAKPELILLDEPTAGVNPTLALELMKSIRMLQEKEGRTFLMVEHNMNVISRICEKCYVLHTGRVLAAGHPEEIQRDENVLKVYLSSDA